MMLRDLRLPSLVVACLLLFAVTSAARTPSTFYCADGYTSALADTKLWSGMALHAIGGEIVFSKGYGLSCPELNTPMRHDHLFPIGSNTKLFTAVSIWQLHAQGKLNVYDDVAKYLDPQDFGLNGTWCPKLMNQTGGPCQPVKIFHMLSMQSGIMGTDNCAYPDGAWQQDYCPLNAGKKAPNLNWADVNNMLKGAWSTTEYIKRMNFLTNPLEFAPTTSYHYSNAGFTVAAYIVEKVSGKNIGQYYREHIFTPVGLKDTFYDLSNEQDGIYAGLLPFPSYTSYVAPISPIWPGSTSSALVIGLNASLAGGNVLDASPPEGPPFGAYVKTTRNMAALGLGDADYTIANAAGAIISTPADMAKWFTAFTSKPQLLGLTQAIVKDMLTLGTPFPGQTNPPVLYVQGTSVVPDNTSRLGASNLFYIGSLGGFEAVIYMTVHPTDASKDEYTGVLGATQPQIQLYTNLTNTGGNCTYNGSPAPQVLCDAKFQHPGPGMSTLVAAKVASARSGMFLGRKQP